MVQIPFKRHKARKYQLKKLSLRWLSFFLGSSTTSGEKCQGVLGKEIANGVQEMIKRREDNRTTLLMHQHLYYTNMHSAEFIHNQLVETKFRINFLESYKVGNKEEMEHHWITGSHIHVKVRNDFNQFSLSFKPCVTSIWVSNGVRNSSCNRADYCMGFAHTTVKQILFNFFPAIANRN